MGSIWNRLSINTITHRPFALLIRVAENAEVFYFIVFFAPSASLRWKWKTKSNYINLHILSKTFFVGVHGFKCSGVQGSILVPGLHLGCVFAGKASASSGLIQNLEPNRQLFGEISIFDKDFGSSMPSLSLTLISDSARPEFVFWLNWPLFRPAAGLNCEPV